MQIKYIAVLIASVGALAAPVAEAEAEAEAVQARAEAVQQDAQYWPYRGRSGYGRFRPNRFDNDLVDLFKRSEQDIDFDDNNMLQARAEQAQQAQQAQQGQQYWYPGNYGGWGWGGRGFYNRGFYGRGWW